MSGNVILKLVNPWRFRREQNEQRLHALRMRDGDSCSRCRRPLRFDLNDGHEMAAKVELILPGSAGGTESLDNLVLCHNRCNAGMIDHTPEVMDRIRRRNEAELLSKPRKRAGGRG
jgi:5-methylcytosine-specific restriction endonuclease McrA